MVTEIRSGIPTTYEASRFRSRLEARWAAFFDLIGWSWVYEPFDANGYIPDFLITGKSPFLVEVGPCATPDQYREKASKALSAFPQRQRVCAKNDHLACIEDGHHPKDDLNMGVASEWIVLVLGV